MLVVDFGVRTDINGYASVSKLSIGDYFVVGTASLGKVGVTWNVPVKLKDDSNKISLTFVEFLLEFVESIIYECRTKYRRKIITTVNQANNIDTFIFC